MTGGFGSSTPRTTFVRLRITPTFGLTRSRRRLNSGLHVFRVHLFSPGWVEEAAAAALPLVWASVLKHAGHHGLRNTTCLLEVRSRRLNTTILPTAEGEIAPDSCFTASRLTRLAAMPTPQTRFSCLALSSCFL